MSSGLEAQVALEPSLQEMGLLGVVDRILPVGYWLEV